MLHNLIPLLLIPACASLNHLGGQSTTIAASRIVCRVFGVGIAFGLVSLLYGLGNENAAYAAGIVTAGMALWAVWKWGPGFMAVRDNVGDRRDYTTSRWGFNYWITRWADKILGVSQLTTLSPSQIRCWGMIYMTLRGFLMYPMFVGLSALLTVWSLLIGLVCFAQGIIYRFMGTVYNAEYVEGGAVIGAGLSAVLLLYKSI